MDLPLKLFINNEASQRSGNPNPISSSINSVQYIESKNGERISLRNPTNDDFITNDVRVAGEEDIDTAVTAAKIAFTRGPWSKFSGIQRAACLHKVAAIIEQNAERLAQLESLPTGRPISGIVHFDLKHMVEVFRCEWCFCIWRWDVANYADYAGWADKIEGRSYVEDNGYYKIVRYEPIGVCAGISSWNATFMYVGWKVAPALAAGNAVSKSA